MKTVPFYVCKCGHKFSSHKADGGECTSHDGVVCWCQHFEPNVPKLKPDEQKQLVLAAFLPLHPFVRVNSAHPEARVPPELRRPDMTMRMGDRYIQELEVNEHGFSGAIFVRGSRHSIFIPWDALDALWVRAPFEGPIVSWKDLPELTAPTPGRRGHLRLVSAPAENEAKGNGDDDKKERA